ncbi:hypothetical protein, partial [Mycobacterium sp. NAZ190054]|uniref:hypothetical protein n=1 Tax=Mycobacterium sp. NAZ190054 TaxID=1747766 RepID=UPI000AF5A770
RSLTQILSPFVPLAESFTTGNFEQILNTPSYMSSIQTSLVVAHVGRGAAPRGGRRQPVGPANRGRVELPSPR